MSGHQLYPRRGLMQKQALSPELHTGSTESSSQGHIRTGARVSCSSGAEHIPLHLGPNPNCLSLCQ